MAISKIIYKSSAEDTGTVWMDTTDKTVAADKMVSGITALKNDGTTVTGNLTSRSSSDLTASGATVTVPAGVYSSQASKAVSSGSATAPATISGSSATVSTGTNTLTLSKTVSVTPSVTAGYVSSGTAGNSAVSLTASVNTRSSSDLTASTLTVTAPSGYYGSDATKTLTDANLLAENIKKDISIFGVTGSYEGGGGQTTWEQVYSGSVNLTATWGDNTFYEMISPWTEVISQNSIWRITLDGTPYECVATWAGHPNANPYALGNYTYEDGGSGGTEYPFFMQMYYGTSLAFVSSYGQHTLLIEKQVSGGGSGLEYESGTYTPSSDVSSASISFTNTHTTRPFCVIMADTTETLADTNSILLFGVSSWYDVFGASFYTTETALRYARILYDYKSSTGSMQSNNAITALTGTGTATFPYWITESGFYAYTTVNTRYFISGRTYKWIAVWAPST